MGRALYPKAQATVNKTPPTGPNQWLSAKEGNKTIWFKSWPCSNGKGWRWLNAVSGKAKHTSMSKADLTSVNKRVSTASQREADANGGKRKCWWPCSDWGGAVTVESHLYVQRIASSTSNPQQAAEKLVKTFKKHIRSLKFNGSPFEDTCRKHLIDLLKALKAGKLAFAVTDVEKRKNGKRLKEACVLIAKLQRNGKVSFKKLCDIVEKKKGAGVSKSHHQSYKAALQKAQADGFLVVHHGGSERDICEAFGLDLNGVADQLGVFRFALGYYHGNRCPLPNDRKMRSEDNADGKVRFPLSMAAFCFMLLGKRQRHTAKQDCYDQARVLVYMLSALLKVYEAASEI